MKYRIRHGRGGFTIIELVCVMAILAILAAAAMPLSELVVRRTKEHELRTALIEIRGALDAYKHAFDTGHIENSAGVSGYPRTLQVLVDGVPDAKNAGQRIYFLRRVPRDPFGDSDSSPAETWQLRSYASSASAPRAGDDVYDVYSGSTDVGLNGVPYHEW